MSSPEYNEYDFESEQYGEIEHESYEEFEPYMTYDEEMAAFEQNDIIFEFEYTDDAYVINDY